MSYMLQRSSVARSLCRACLQQQKRFASDLPAPPMLLKLRGDMKKAMKDKDAARLSVLRSVLAEVTNSAKTNNPMKTDVQLLAFLRKRAQASRDAAVEFQNANRTDLVEKENAQSAVLEEYAGGVEVISEDEIKSIVQEVIGNIRVQETNANQGTVLREAFKPGGPFEGKPVDKAQVAAIVKGML